MGSLMAFAAAVDPAGREADRESAFEGLLDKGSRRNHALIQPCGCRIGTSDVEASFEVGLPSQLTQETTLSRRGRRIAERQRRRACMSPGKEATHES